MTSATRSSAAMRLGALADELVSLDLDDADAREAARRQAWVAQVDDAVDLGRLPRRPALPGERGVLARSVDQDVRHRAGERGAPLPGQAILRLLYDRGALGRHLGRDLIGVRHGRRPLFGRVGEDTEAVEADFVKELEQILERRLGLPGKADEDGGADGEPRDRVTECADDVSNPFRGHGAP